MGIDEVKKICISLSEITISTTRKLEDGCFEFREMSSFIDKTKAIKSCCEVPGRTGSNSRCYNHRPDCLVGLCTRILSYADSYCWLTLSPAMIDLGTLETSLE